MTALEEEENGTVEKLISVHPISRFRSALLTLHHSPPCDPAGLTPAPSATCSIHGIRHQPVDRASNNAIHALKG